MKRKGAKMNRLKPSRHLSIFVILIVIGTIVITLPSIAKWSILQKRDPDIRDYMSIVFTGEQTGWVVGSAAFEDFENPGFIAYTTNGGALWNKSKIKLKADVLNIFFLNDTHGWVVGAKGVIANTTNGKDWDIQISKVDTGLKSIYFVNEEIGYAVGENETIISTRNGGRVWKVLSGGIVGNVGDDETTMFSAVQFLDEKTGWAAGVRVFPANKTQKSVIQKTTDGAQTWVMQETGKEDIIEDIYFLDANVGWAVGENGVILHTDNGGQKWQEQTSDTTETLRSVRFADKHTGWAVGGDFGVGVVLTTHNGGKKWDVQEADQKMMKVHVLDQKNTWLAGVQGLILKSDPTK